jgi:hypothetical protein
MTYADKRFFRIVRRLVETGAQHDTFYAQLSINGSEAFFKGPRSANACKDLGDHVAAARVDVVHAATLVFRDDRRFLDVYRITSAGATRAAADVVTLKAEGKEPTRFFIGPLGAFSPVERPDFAREVFAAWAAI